MSLEEKDLDIIDAFLLDRLSTEDRLYFDKRMSDSTFSEYLQEQKQLKEVVEKKGRIKLKRTLQSIEAAYENESAVGESKSADVIPFYKNRRLWGVAASLVLLVSIFGLFKMSEELNIDELYAASYSPYPNLIDPITKGEATVYSPYQVYESGDYKGAIIALLGASESDDRNWYLAQSYMALGEDQEAEALLKSIIESTTSQYRQPAQWYTALMLLRQEDVSDAKTILDAIVKAADHPYAARAADLLREI